MRYAAPGLCPAVPGYTICVVPGAGAGSGGTMLRRGAVDEVGLVPQPSGLKARGLLAGVRSWRLGLSPGDRAALGVWAAAHVALFVLAWAAAWVYRTTPSHQPLTGVFERWDAILLRNIAHYGYF